MTSVLQKTCLFCRERFVTTVRNQIYCSNACYLAAKADQRSRKSERCTPTPVKIRLLDGLPVFPEFQLEPGEIYDAIRHQSCAGDRMTYIVTLDEKHQTIVRQEECEEVYDE